METPKIHGKYDDHAFLDYDQSNDFILHEIGNYICPPLYSYGPIARTRDIFHFVMKGCGKLVIRDKEFEVHKGQGFLIPSDERAYYISDRNDPWEYFWLHLSGARLPEIWRRSGISADSPVFTSDSDEDTMTQLYLQIAEKRNRELYVMGKVYEMMDFIVSTSKHRQVVVGNAQLEYVRKIIKIIQLKYAEPLHTAYMAEACGLNRSYMSRLFKDATGLSIHTYLTDYRMKKATHLLKETDETIQNIASLVGYSDVFTFSKAFKRVYGNSPSDYRASLGNTLDPDNIDDN